MYLRTFILVLLALAASTQMSPQQPPNLRPDAPDVRHQDDDEAPPPASAASVSPDTPVISIAGICNVLSGATTSQPSAKRDANSEASSVKSKTSGSSAVSNPECTTVVTKAQFETLVDAFNPNMRAVARRNLAESYPRSLVFANKARELGLDKDPRFAEMMRFAALQLLSQRLNRYFEEQASIVSDSEVEKYYRDNALKFERADLLRIFVPKQSHEMQKNDSGQPGLATSSSTLSLAQQLRARAERGEDFQQLQKEAFEAAGVPSESPNVRLGKIAPTGIPVNHQNVFKLEAGQVSDLIVDPAGYYIYKMIAKEIAPLSRSKEEIRKSISFQRVQDWSASLINSVKADLNPTYFGSSPRHSDPKFSKEVDRPPTK